MPNRVRGLPRRFKNTLSLGGRSLTNSLSTSTVCGHSGQSHFVALARYAHETGATQSEIPDRDVCCFVRSSTGVVEKQQHCMVTYASFRAAIWCRQHRMDLRLLQVGHRRCGRLPEGNCSHLAAPSDVFGVTRTDEFCQRVNCTETQIARSPTATAFRFQVFKKSAHHSWRQILNGQPIDRFACGECHKWK